VIDVDHVDASTPYPTGIPPAPVTGQVGPIGPDGLRATDPPGSTVDPTAPPVPVNGSDTSGTTSKNDPAKDQTSKKSPGGDR
jgi:hypothetical protein